MDDSATADAAGSSSVGSGTIGAGAVEPASFATMLDFFDRGGIAIWVIAALSVVTVAILLWKSWRLARAGAWRRDRAEAAVDLWVAGKAAEARRTAAEGMGLRAQIVKAALDALATPNFDEPRAREETTRVARRALAEAGTGLRALELIATIAPLLGLFGTVLGMISAFQAFEAAAVTAEPADLAGGIWEALLTTAAGMAVAIVASMGLSWFESVIEALRRDLEDLATRIFTHAEGRVAALRDAAE